MALTQIMNTRDKIEIKYQDFIRSIGDNALKITDMKRKINLKLHNTK